MNQSEIVVIKLHTGDTLDVKAIEVLDPEFMYGFHTLMIAAGSNDIIRFTLNGSDIELPGSAVMDKMSIRTLDVVSTHVEHATDPGIVVIGSKTKRSIF